MFPRWIKSLLVLPVLIAAWLLFTTTPVSGLALSELAMFELPASDTVAEAETSTEVAELAVGGQP